MPRAKVAYRIDPNQISFLRPIDTIISIHSSFDIFINLSEKTKKITISPNTTVSELKIQLEAELEIPVADQRLSFQTKDLRDEVMIKDYDIKENNTLFLALRVRGGRLPIDALERKGVSTLWILQMSVRSMLEKDQLSKETSDMLQKALTNRVISRGEPIDFYFAKDMKKYLRKIPINAPYQKEIDKVWKEVIIPIIEREQGDLLANISKNKGLFGAKELSSLKLLVKIMVEEGRLSKSTFQTIEKAIIDTKDDKVVFENNVKEFLINTYNKKEYNEIWEIIISVIISAEPKLLYGVPNNTRAKISTTKYAKYLEEIKNRTLKIIEGVKNKNYDKEIIQIFGKDSLLKAKEKYENAGIELDKLWRNFEVDLSGGMDEMGVGGLTYYEDKTICLPGSFFSASKEGAIAVLLHESLHLGNLDVVDYAYSGSSFYLHYSEDKKLKNADHFAELARIIFNRSKYKGQDFISKPKNLKTVTKLSEHTLATRILKVIWETAYDSLCLFRDFLTSTVHVSDAEKKERKGLGEEYKYWACALNLPNKLIDTITLLDLAVFEAFVRKLHLYSTSIRKIKTSYEGTNDYILHVFKEKGVFWEEGDEMYPENLKLIEMLWNKYK